eukprot:1056571-Prorocentrum_minimum.AAC.2
MPHGDGGHHAGVEPACKSNGSGCESSKPECESSEPGCESSKPRCESSDPGCESSDPGCESSDPGCGCRRPGEPKVLRGVATRTGEEDAKGHVGHQALHYRLDHHVPGAKPSTTPVTRRPEAPRGGLLSWLAELAGLDGAGRAWRAC